MNNLDHKVQVWLNRLPADVAGWLRQKCGINDNRPFAILLEGSGTLKELREKLGSIKTKTPCSN